VLLVAAVAGFVLAVVCIVRAVIRPLKYTYSAVLRFAHSQSHALERGAFIALLRPDKAKYRMQIDRMINYAILKHDIIELASENWIYCNGPGRGGPMCPPWRGMQTTP
jgi:hypothetical protein